MKKEDIIDIKMLADTMTISEYVTLLTNRIETCLVKLEIADKHAQLRTDYINQLLDKIVALEKECGRDPGDY